ncbi:UDP-N-acetylmuramate dehydrogenase [Tengunoibacter tsumagoiensis]|uniref:UDP-N-acetylenolpyruvoylglucosamine reductase n=1 Tax=Tengunoibacter tsumagoiensis TaxID=2014871 RepID=A0A401ZXQ4_9CHLR|nr:UDP-N-acetylmuramate dehydrogenase [Tengunoibacter tsumagoiensis]GCE11620.1 UDP-N-acetylenolpyruvoylglucosamine reductase [Tengunoibacter tsumagoiensis]
MVFDTHRAYEVLSHHFHKRVHCQEPLAQHSSFSVGGEADLWITLETPRELADLIGLCSQEHWPLLVVGSGSNTLYADNGVRGIVARMDAHNYQVETQPDGSAIVTATAGVTWSELLHAVVPLGWGGLEFGIGIPGTLGAGVVSNAGAHNQDLGQALLWIEVLDARGCNVAMEDEYAHPLLRRYVHADLELGYLHSRFRKQPAAQIDPDGNLLLAAHHLISPAEFIVTLALRLHRQDPTELLALLDQHREYRKQTEPSQLHLGSIFKNPPDTTAHDLIDKAGLRGKTCGNAQISLQNANYIVNLGGARAQDIVDLMIEAHQRVLKQSHVSLELNVELLGAWPYRETE